MFGNFTLFGMFSPAIEAPKSGLEKFPSISPFLANLEILRQKVQTLYKESDFLINRIQVPEFKANQAETQEKIIKILQDNHVTFSQLLAAQKCVIFTELLKQADFVLHNFNATHLQMDANPAEENAAFDALIVSLWKKITGAMKKHNELLHFVRNSDRMYASLAAQGTLFVTSKILFSGWLFGLVFLAGTYAKSYTELNEARPKSLILLENLRNDLLLVSGERGIALESDASIIALTSFSEEECQAIVLSNN